MAITVQRVASQGNTDNLNVAGSFNILEFSFTGLAADVDYRLAFTSDVAGSPLWLALNSAQKQLVKGFLNAADYVENVICTQVTDIKTRVVGAPAANQCKITETKGSSDLGVQLFAGEGLTSPVRLVFLSRCTVPALGVIRS